MKNLNSKLFYSLTGAAAVASLPSCAPKQAEPQGPYNIVYIMTDDHTAQMMSCYDRRYVHTPNLDRIAEDGVRFTNSFVANSLSGPSRACMITGKHSHANGFADNEPGTVFDNTQQTFPKLLQAAGYQTAVVGKWHLKSVPTGFDYWEIIPGQGDYYNPSFITMERDTIIEKGYLTNIITDKSLEWIDKRDKERPFCILIHHKAVHRNWLPELKYLNEYEDKTFALPDTFYDEYEGRPAAEAQEMHILKDMDIIYDNKMMHKDKNTLYKGAYLSFIGRLTPEERKIYDEAYAPIIKDFYEKDLQGKELAEWKYQRYMRDYAKVTRTLDDNVGRLMEYLRENGMLENTLVVYTSDQGFYMGEHGWFDKRFMYEESLSTPLLMRLPDGYNRRGEITDMVQNIDYAPTFLEMAGVKVPSDIQGKSLVPLLKGEKTIGKWRDAIYYHFHEYPAEHAVKRHYGVRTERYKLIHFYNDIDTWELYDLQEDPTEMKNVYDDPAYAKVRKQMHKKLQQMQKMYKDPIEETLAAK